MKSLEKVFKSFYYALHGLYDVFKSSLNFRIGILITFLVAVTGFIVKLGLFSWLVVIFTCALVLAAEALNTGAEKMLDFFHPERHPEIGHVKDIMASAVAICVIGALFVGIIIFGNAFYYLLK